MLVEANFKRICGSLKFSNNGVGIQKCAKTPRRYIGSVDGLNVNDKYHEIVSSDQLYVLYVHENINSGFVYMVAF